MRCEAGLRRDKIRCTQLDDRLGVWVLLSLLPKLGFSNFDVLLTDSEEQGQSTAQYFQSERDYNWIFEFDRVGTDCALYYFEDSDTVGLVEDYGWQVGSGSFTDICELDDLGVKGFNFGAGYHLQHTKRCYADLTETVASARRFVRFATDLADTPLPHTRHSIWRKCDKVEALCFFCGAELSDEWPFCPGCGDRIDDRNDYDEDLDAWSYEREAATTFRVRGT